MRTWLSRTALGRGVALVALTVAAVTGCAAAGQLHDAGETRPIAAHPSPQLLWPAAAASPSPTPEASTSQPPPSPLPGITAPGDDLRGLDARTVLDKDPGVHKDERAALTGCQGCLVQPAQYRDLSGDGRPELITAVVTGSEGAYLHVYALRDGQILPVLSQKVPAGFTADTVGEDLVVHEPNGPQSQTNTTYRWKSVRMVFVDRQIRSTGPASDATGCVPKAPMPTATEPAEAEPKASASPTIRLPAPARPSP